MHETCLHRFVIPSYPFPNTQWCAYPLLSDGLLGSLAGIAFPPSCSRSSSRMAFGPLVAPVQRGVFPNEGYSGAFPFIFIISPFKLGRMTLHCRQRGPDPNHLNRAHNHLLCNRLSNSSILINIFKMEGCGTVDNPVSVEAYVYDGKPEHIIGVVLTGPPEERGRTYGRWLRHQIQANVDWHKGHPHLPLW